MREELMKNDLLVEKILLKVVSDMSTRDDYFIEKSKEDIRWTLLFLQEAIKLDSVKLFENYLSWCLKTFEFYGLGSESVKELINAIEEVCSEIEFIDTLKFLDKVELIEKNIDIVDLETGLLSNECIIFIDYILNAKRKEAMKFIHELISQDVSIEDVYLHIFQKALYHVGNLWQRKEISVAQEHYATIVVQYIMSSLYDSIFDGKTKKNKLLAVSIGNELHEVGIRMISDLFEMNGWDTNYLGSNIPVSEVIDYALKDIPDLLAISVTMSYHLNVMKELIDKVKNTVALSNVKILVGGRPFTLDDKLYTLVGADAYAKSIEDALEAGGSLIEE